MSGEYKIFCAAHRLLSSRFRRHAIFYAVVNGSLVVISLITDAPGWLFWAFVAWTVLIAAHFLYVKSVSIDDRWVGERTEDLRSRSYDLGHIQSIEDRVKKDDPSVRPADKRK